MTWTLWLAAAAVLLLLEVFTPGFLLACLAVGAAGASAGAALELPLEAQLALFSVFSGLSLWLLRPVLRTWFSATGAKTNQDALIGAVGRVESAVVAGQRGYVKLDGDSWAFEADRDYAAATKVRITHRDGNVVTVESAD
ncbi:MAG: NfeD family protein [Bacteroidota bacterium]|jgi:membrane protein implicated in regulation of membrane protease activity